MKNLIEFDRNELYKVVLALESENECKRFLRDLLTITEIDEFSNRWKVARMLNQKLPYKEIENATGMSSTTIARISKWMTDGMGGYKLMLKRLFSTTDSVRLDSHHHTRPKVV